MTTKEIIKQGLDNLNTGNLKIAKEKFEEACVNETENGNKPEENEEILFLMKNLLAAEALTALEKNEPEEFEKLYKWAKKENEGELNSFMEE